MDKSHPHQIITILIILAMLLTSLGMLLSQPNIKDNIRSYTDPTPQNKEKLIDAIHQHTPISCSIEKEGINITYIIGESNQYYFSASYPQDDKTEYISYNVSDGNNIYIWDNNSQTGTLIPLLLNTSDQSPDPTQTYTELIDNASKVKCSSLKSTNKPFSPPTTINFSPLKTN
jgi:hypothetical protein